jgi:hypothetical protein
MPFDALVSYHLQKEVTANKNQRPQSASVSNCHSISLNANNLAIMENEELLHLLTIPQ